MTKTLHTGGPTQALLIAPIAVTPVFGQGGHGGGGTMHDAAHAADMRGFHAPSE